MVSKSESSHGGWTHVKESPLNPGRFSLDGPAAQGLSKWLLAACAAHKEVSHGYSAKRFPGMLLEVRVGAVASFSVTDSCRAHAH
jgi:hypothetical protein